MFDLEPDEARLLLNIALMATGRNRFQSAAKLLDVLERFRPDQASVAVSKTILKISTMDFQGAIDYVDQVAHPKFPDSAMLLAFKGMALIRLARKDEAIRTLAEAAASEDTAAANLAKDLMN